MLNPIHNNLIHDGLAFPQGANIKTSHGTSSPARLKEKEEIQKMREIMKDEERKFEAKSNISEATSALHFNLFTITDFIYSPHLEGPDTKS